MTIIIGLYSDFNVDGLSLEIMKCVFKPVFHCKHQWTSVC